MMMAFLVMVPMDIILMITIVLTIFWQWTVILFLIYLSLIQTLLTLIVLTITGYCIFRTKLHFEFLSY